MAMGHGSQDGVLGEPEVERYWNWKWSDLDVDGGGGSVGRRLEVREQTRCNTMSMRGLV